MTDKRYCNECGDPLGSTYRRCHDCGGPSKRGGDPFDTGSGWKVEMGLLPRLQEFLNPEEGDDE